MKRIVFLIGALLTLPVFFTPAFAQEDDSFAIVSTPDGVVSLDAASHIGFGYNLLKSDSFTSSGSGEFFVNILDLKVYPSKSFGVEIGVDYKTMDFNSKENYFYLDSDKKIQAGKAVDQYGGMDKFRSRFRSNTFSAPVTLNLVAGTTKLSVGVEGNMNLTGRVKNKYFENGQKVKDIQKGAQFNRYNYNFFAALSFDGTGVYFRYYPKNSELLPAGSVKVGFMSVGAIFDM
jgi:hypothetical protein